MNKKVENVEGSLNKRIDGLGGSLNQKIDNLQSSITRPTKIGSTSNPALRMDEVKAVITLRNGKQVDQPMPKPAKETREEEGVEP